MVEKLLKIVREKIASDRDFYGAWYTNNLALRRIKCYDIIDATPELQEMTEKEISEACRTII